MPLASNVSQIALILDPLANIVTMVRSMTLEKSNVSDISPIIW